MVLSNRPYAGGSHPPRVPSVLAWVAVVASAILLVVGRARPGATLSAVGWLLGVVVPMACLIVHRLRDRVLWARPDYTRDRLSGPVAALAPVAGLAAGAPHAWEVSWFLAQWFQR